MLVQSPLSLILGGKKKSFHLKTLVGQLASGLSVIVLGELVNTRVKTN